MPAARSRAGPGSATRGPETGQAPAPRNGSSVVMTTETEFNRLAARQGWYTFMAGQAYAVATGKAPSKRNAEVMAVEQVMRWRSEVSRFPARSAGGVRRADRGRAEQPGAGAEGRPVSRPRSRASEVFAGRERLIAQQRGERDGGRPAPPETCSCRWANGGSPGVRPRGRAVAARRFRRRRGGAFQAEIEALTDVERDRSWERSAPSARRDQSCFRKTDLQERTRKALEPLRHPSKLFENGVAFGRGSIFTPAAIDSCTS